MKTYIVEFSSTTYRDVVVEATNKDDAADKAYEQLQSAPEVSRAWSENAEVISIKVQEDES